MTPNQLLRLYKKVKEVCDIYRLTGKSSSHSFHKIKKFLEELEAGNKKNSVINVKN